MVLASVRKWAKDTEQTNSRTPVTDMQTTKVSTAPTDGQFMEPKLGCTRQQPLWKGTTNLSLEGRGLVKKSRQYHNIPDLCVDIEI